MAEFRMKRVNELMLRELSTAVRRLLSVDRCGVISFTDVEVSRDLKTAVVWFSTVGTQNGAPALAEQEALALLNRARPELQQAVARRVAIKYTPHLSFRHDSGLERGQHVVRLLEELEKGQKT
ncbi:MAG: 30S ribosome-binding factor RbfA [Verrucomicrobiia bacterium]|jgi:ribosome-binding factor A